MISQICGSIVQRTEDGLIIDVHGLCYEVLVPVAILRSLDGQVGAGGTVRLVTFHYHHVEPSRATPILVGFTNEVEREFFERFITVSGVGPRAALRAISQPIPLIARAIDEGDLEFLRRLPGIGPQRAKEIVAKLQGKVGKFGLIQAEAVTIEAPHDVAEEARAVLLQLQYTSAEAKAMIQRAVERVPTVATAEELLNEVYRQRSAARRGFSLLELMMVLLVVAVLVTITIPIATRAMERSRASEAYGTFAFLRAGYLAFRARAGTTDPTWHDLGVADPNGASRRFFDYQLLTPGQGGRSPELTGHRAQALRRTDPSAQWLELQLENGEVRKSAPY